MATLRGSASTSGLWNFDTYATCMDFLVDRFDGRPLAHDGDVLYLESGGVGPDGAAVPTKRRWFDN
jgi:hypothetical protein